MTEMRGWDSNNGRGSQTSPYLHIPYSLLTLCVDVPGTETHQSRQENNAPSWPTRRRTVP